MTKVLCAFKIGDRFAQLGTFGPFAKITSTRMREGKRFYTLTGEENAKKSTFSEGDLKKKCYKVN